MRAEVAEGVHGFAERAPGQRRAAGLGVEPAQIAGDLGDGEAGVGELGQLAGAAQPAFPPAASRAFGPLAERQHPFHVRRVEPGAQRLERAAGPLDGVSPFAHFGRARGATRRD